MASEIDVTEEAQKRLCRFSYLSHCVGTMEERAGVLKKKITSLNDASEEIEVSFVDDDLWIRVGELLFLFFFSLFTSLSLYACMHACTLYNSNS